MDAYIEATGDWVDFQGAWTVHCCDSLNERLPEGYAARVTSRLKLVRAEEVAAEAAGNGREIESQTLALPVDHDEIRESSVQIIRYPQRRLVTHIELLSPTNKRNPDRGEYLAKRVALIHQQKVNMVEIDLLLAGERLETVEPLPPGDYYAFVTRADRLPKVDVYAWNVDRALPSIPVPLLPPDPDVRLELATLVTQVYDRGRYRQLLDYRRPLHLPLTESARAWAERIAGAGVP